MAEAGGVCCARADDFADGVSRRAAKSAGVRTRPRRPPAAVVGARGAAARGRRAPDASRAEEGRRALPPVHRRAGGGGGRPAVERQPQDSRLDRSCPSAAAASARASASAAPSRSPPRPTSRSQPRRSSDLGEHERSSEEGLGAFGGIPCDSATFAAGTSESAAARLSRCDTPNGSPAIRLTARAVPPTTSAVSGRGGSNARASAGISRRALAIRLSFGGSPLRNARVTRSAPASIERIQLAPRDG